MRELVASGVLLSFYETPFAKNAEFSQSLKDQEKGHEQIGFHAITSNHKVKVEEIEMKTSAPCVSLVIQEKVLISCPLTLLRLTYVSVVST